MQPAPPPSSVAASAPNAATATTAAPSSNLSSSGALDDAPSCRVCWGGPEEGNALLQPCQCRGSLAYIHRRCLQQWRQVCRENGRRRNAQLCDICGAPLVLPGSRLGAALRSAAGLGAAGGDDDLTTTTDSGLEDDENDERRAARRADVADRRRRRRQRLRGRRRAAGFVGDDDDDGDDTDDTEDLLVAGPFFVGNGQLVPALDLGAVMADSLRDPLWWAGALHGALRAYVALTGVAAASRVWAQVLRAKRLGPGGVAIGGGGGGVVAGSSPSAHVTAALRGPGRVAAAAGGNGGNNNNGQNFLDHPHFAFVKGLGIPGTAAAANPTPPPPPPQGLAARLVGTAAVGAASATGALPAAPPAAAAPSSAAALQAAARAAQAAGGADPSSSSANALACPAALRPYIVREFTQAVEQGAQFQVAAHTTLAALASGADADAYSGLALGAVVASAVSELVFLPLLGAGKKGAASAVARLIGRTAWRLCAGALCTRDGYRLFCRGALAVADVLAGWRTRRRRRARRMARERAQAAQAAQAQAQAEQAEQVVVAGAAE